MFRKVAKNTFFLSASQIGARVIGFFYFIFLARQLGVENFGVYSFVLSFVYNFIPIADFGLERLILRDLSRQPEKSDFYSSRLFSLRFFLSLASYGLMLAIGLILGQSARTIFYLALFGLILLPRNLTFLLVNLPAAQEKMGSLALANILSSLMMAPFGVVVILVRMPLWWLFFSTSLSTLGVLVFFLSQSTKLKIKLSWSIDWNFWQYIMKESWPLAMLSILSVFYLRASTILVGLLKGDYATGLYSAAFKFIEAIILIPQAVAWAAFPLSSRLYQENKQKLRSVYKKGMGALLLFSLPFVLVLSGAPKLVINLAYGQNYTEAVPVMLVLGLSLILFFVNVMPLNLILASPKTRHFLPWLGLNYLLALTTGWLLIRQWSIIGAAWMVVVGEAIGFVINNLFVYNILRRQENEQKESKYRHS